MNANSTELYHEIAAYSLDSAGSPLGFTRRLARENRWSTVYARRVIDQYKRFMFLTIVADHPVTPSEDVDQAWHLHLVYTRSYWDDFCDRVLGKRIHHEPTRGGASELERHQVQYERTLASYRHWFNERPPADIWPPTEVRFGQHSQSVRVSKGSAWIVPKPWALMRLQRSTGLWIGAGALPALVGIANPLNFKGPQFLMFYAVVCLTGIVAASILRAMLRNVDEHRDIDESSLSHYEIACLARGVPGVLQAALAALVGSGRLRIVENEPRRFGPIRLGKTTYRLQADGTPTSDGTVEQALLAAASTPGGAEPRELLDAAKGAAESIQTELQTEGLMESDDSFSSARWGPVVVVGAAALLGVAKLVIGIWRDKPVGFLVISLIGLAIVTAWFWRRPLRTRAGEKLYRKIELGHEALRHLDATPSLGVGTPEMVLAAGLFGLTAIDNPDIQKLAPAIATAPSSVGGTGCGSGCSGGCGGGCGGCGGCGG